jgi:ribosomal-protein-alanine N-acetyltransferase
MVPAELSYVYELETRATPFPWPASQFRSSLNSGDDCLVAVVEDKVVGFLIFSAVLDEGTLINFAIDPDYQGRGFGRESLELGLLQQLEQGVTQCFLEVRASNTRAIRLYRSLNFRKVGVRKNYYPAKSEREDAVVMSRILPIEMLGEI